MRTLSRIGRSVALLTLAGLIGLAAYLAPGLARPDADDQAEDS